MLEVSPYKYEKGREQKLLPGPCGHDVPGPHIWKVPAPRLYRGLYREADNDTTMTAYARALNIMRLTVK